MNHLIARFSKLAVFAAMVGCGYDSNSPYPVPNPALQEGLWTSSGSNPAILRLAPSQLLASVDQTPATAIVTSSADLSDLNAVAFDTDGTLWVASKNDSVLLAFAPATLAHSGATAATRIIISVAGSLSGPTSLAFDAQHRLWVANGENGTLVRFSREQLTSAGGALVPEVVISGLGRPSAIAFDAAGSLWLSDGRRNKLAAFGAAQLGTSGFLAPQVVISSIGPSIAVPAGIAFDSDGNLWVANIGNQTVVGFTPAQLAATGSPLPNVVLSSNAGSLNIPAGLAFDADGSLWVMGGTGVLDKFPRAALAVTGAPAPSVQLGVTGYVLFWGVAFWPTPAALPLN